MVINVKVSASIYYTAQMYTCLVHSTVNVIIDLRRDDAVMVHFISQTVQFTHRCSSIEVTLFVCYCMSGVCCVVLYT